jgi:hypothetical protein
VYKAPCQRDQAVVVVGGQIVVQVEVEASVQCMKT